MEKLHGKFGEIYELSQIVQKIKELMTIVFTYDRRRENYKN